MPSFPTTIAQSIASLGLTIAQAARKIGGDEGYKAAHKRLTKYTKTPPTSLALLEADLDTLGLQITITPKPRP